MRYCCMVRNLCRFFNHFFIYLLPLEIQESKGESWDPIIRLNATTFFVHFPSHDLDFQRYKWWHFFLLNELRWEVTIMLKLFIITFKISFHCEFLFLDELIKVILETRHTHYVNVREYRKSNGKSTIQRNWHNRVHKTMKTKTKTQHNMCWTPLYANKHIT